MIPSCEFYMFTYDTKNRSEYRFYTKFYCENVHKSTFANQYQL